MLGHPGKNGLSQHRFHFARNSGQPKETFSRSKINAESRGGADGIGHDLRAFWKQSLFFVVRCPNLAARFGAAPEGRNYILVQYQAPAEESRHGFVCEVVGSWSQTAGANNQVPKIDRLSKRPKNLFPVVADLEHRFDGNAGGIEFVRDIG